MKRPPKTAIACINCRHYDQDYIRSNGRIRRGGIAPCLWVADIVLPKAMQWQADALKHRGSYMAPYPVHDCKTFELIASDKP